VVNVNGQQAYFYRPCACIGHVLISLLSQ